MRLHPAVLASLALTLFAWYVVTASLDRYESARFTRRAVELQKNIAFQMETYVNALVQTKSMMAIAPQLSRLNFKRYVDSLGLIENYPGIQGIGYTVRIRAAALRSHVEQVRRSGFPQYAVWPQTPRADYFSILYLEPFDWRNQRAFGYDMYTEPTRRSAMAAARDLGQPAASGKITLVQETHEKQQPGFLIYVPVYQNGMPTQTVDQRRAALRGFVYSPFRAHDLFQGIVRTGGIAANIDFAVYDGPTATADNLLYHYAGNADPARPRSTAFQKSLQLEVAGRPWSVLITALPGFSSGWTRSAPVVTLLAGLSITLLLFLMLRATQKELNASARTAMLAKQLEAEREVLAILNRVGQNLAAELDLDKLVQSITDAATRLSNAEFGALFYRIDDSSREGYLLYALSGAPRAAFANFPLPRNTAIFSPTFSGERIVRSADITKEPGFGKNAPYHGMPKGHLPVVSYLAVPVVTRSGEVIGGLFFGHSRAGVFNEREEKLVAGIAAQAAIAMDNAKLYQRAQQAIGVRDEFLTVASHELKTPISTVKMQLQMFRRMIGRSETPVPGADKFLKGLDACDRQVARLVTLVEDLLNVSQIKAGRLDFRYEPTDLVELTKRVVEQIAAPEITPQEVRVEAPDSLTVDCDRFRIEQVIINLLTNALKYGDGKPIRVAVEATADGTAAVIKVTDQGMGIEPDHQARIFERFQRAVSHKNISGLGLGLYIAKQIVDAHDGRITVQSVRGQGSTFTVELPIKSRYTTHAASTA